MPNYRRMHVPGGTYFFTVNLLDRKSNILTAQIDLLRTAVRFVRTERPFRIDAWVVLPDHMHAIWTLPDGDSDYSSRWRAIKKRFTWALPPMEPRSAVQRARNERGIWQPRFWEHTIRDARDFTSHMDYVHFNPVKHGLVQAAADWPFSSFHLAVARGLYAVDWCAGVEPAGEWGERAEA
jgi:putative transposase